MTIFRLSITPSLILRWNFEPRTSNLELRTTRPASADFSFQVQCSRFNVRGLLSTGSGRARMWAPRTAHDPRLAPGGKGSSLPMNLPPTNAFHFLSRAEGGNRGCSHLDGYFERTFKITVRFGLHESPGAFPSGACQEKRQRTAAVQDAVAPCHRSRRVRGPNLCAKRKRAVHKPGSRRAWAHFFRRNRVPACQPAIAPSSQFV